MEKGSGVCWSRPLPVGSLGAGHSCQLNSQALLGGPLHTAHSMPLGFGNYSFSSLWVQPAPVTELTRSLCLPLFI